MDSLDIKFNKIDLASTKEIFAKWLILDETEIIDVVLATIIANRLPGDPIWLFMVAPPGGTKTEILRSLQTEEIFQVSTLSEHSLVSGFRQKPGAPDPSLIPKLHNKVLVIKDFTAILSMRRESREEILGTLRDAYDGECVKTFGSIGVVKYVSKFGILAGVTPAVDKYFSIEQSLGERFLKIRLKTKSHEEMVSKSFDNIAFETSMRQELSMAVTKLLHTIGIPDIAKIRYIEACSDKLKALSRLLAILRSDVSRNPYTHTIDYMPEPEVGTRIIKQLSKLGIGLAAARNKETVDEEEYRLLLRIAFDTLPSKKRKIFDVISQLRIDKSIEPYDNQFVDTQEISNYSDLPTDTCKSALEDLRLLGIVDRSGSNRFTWRLTDTIQELIIKAGVT